MLCRRHVRSTLGYRAHIGRCSVVRSIVIIEFNLSDSINVVGFATHAGMFGVALGARDGM